MGMLTRKAEMLVLDHPLQEPKFKLTAWIAVEEHISPLPVEQVGESTFVNTSTTPPVTCSEPEL